MTSFKTDLAPGNDTLRDYLDQRLGLPIRDTARFYGEHPSTCLRRSRRMDEVIEENPDWNFAVEKMADCWAEKSRRARTVNRSFVLEALGLEEAETLGWWKKNAAHLKSAQIIVSDLPNAILVLGENTIASMSREIAVFGLICGWIDVHASSEKLRRYKLTPRGSEAVSFSQGSVPKEEVIGGRISPNKPRGRIATCGIESPVLRTFRRHKNLLNREDIRAAEFFRAAYINRSRSDEDEQKFNEVSERVSPRTLKVLVDLVGEEIGLEEFEAKTEYPARSAKALLSHALESLRFAEPSLNGAQ